MKEIAEIFDINCPKCGHKFEYAIDTYSHKDIMELEKFLDAEVISRDYFAGRCAELEEQLEALK